MATWNSANSMLTQTGVAILNKVKAGVGSITVSRIVAGSSSVATSALYTQTSVSGVQKEFSISGVNTTDGGSEIAIYITNELITEDYPLHQIGIYVTHPDYNGEQLYHISQCESEGVDIIPKLTDSVTTMAYSLYMEHANANTVSITVSQQGMLLAKVFDAFKENLQEDKLITVNSDGNLIASGKNTVSGTNSVTITNAEEHRALNVTITGQTTQVAPTVANPTKFISTKVFDIRSKGTGNNLFNVKATPLRNSAKFGTTYTVTNDSVTMSCGGSSVCYIGYLIPVTVGTKYTIHFVNATNSIISYTQLDTPITTITSSEYGTDISGTSLTITASKPYLLICSHSQVSTTGLTFGTNRLQVIEGTTANSNTYNSYVGDTVVLPSAIELNNFNGYSDTIEWDGSKWWYVQRIGNVIIDGTTNKVSTGVMSGNTTYSRCSFALNNNAMSYITDALYGTPVATTHGNTVSDTSEFYAYYNTGSRIVAGHFLFSTFGLTSSMDNNAKVSAINTWLANQNTAGNPLTLRYVLAEPKVTEIAVTDVINMYESMTKVSATSTVYDSTVKVGYALNTTDPTTMYILKSLARKSDIQTANTFALATLIDE